MSTKALLAILAAAAVPAAERAVNPTFLRRHVPSVAAKPSDLTTVTCRYKPLFGAGDPDTSIVRGVARFGEITVDPGGRSELVNYPAEEQIYVILEGAGTLHYGDETHPIRKNDFLYLPPGVRHGVSNPASRPCRLVVYGYKIPAGEMVERPAKLQIANTGEVKKQVVGNHPPSTLYQLLMGDTSSKRDRLAAAHILTSLFIMEIAPGGTNHPHHHETEEEIYLLLEGEGDMVAGSGMNGIEGRYPAKPGDAFFYRLNATVGFYNTGSKTAYILAARSRFPFRNSAR